MLPGPLADLKALLYQLYLQAGTPTLDQIASWIAEDKHGNLAGAPARDTIARIIGDAGMPPSQADVRTVATVLARAARWDPDDAAGRARDLWVTAQMTPAVGVPLAEVTNPFSLEVHRPVELEGASLGLPPLPPYVRRVHDGRLDEVAARAAGGESVMAVLVAGSSAGKTRACWEALQPLRQAGGWRLWHPYDPTRPEAVLQELPHVRPRTVVWLNETQEYLAGESGERVAAGLRALLAAPARAPVLVLGTLWPDHHAALTHRDGSQVRHVLDGTVIEVPAAFTSADLAALQKTATADDRLAWAAEHAEDGQVTQYLAGGPALLERYRTAPPTARALISSAMDARRLGMGAGLPQAFLEAAAPEYLTGAEWDGLGEDWLEQALAYTAVPCKGVRGPLTRIRPRPASRAARHRGDQPGSLAAAAGPLYRLADYLDQHGRAHRASQIPPAEFWSAAAAHAAPGDQAALGDAAHDRGLYRDAAQLHKNAAASGNHSAALYLSRLPACLRADPRPAHWAAAHAPLDNPYAVAWLLDILQKAGADEQAAALLARDPATHATLDNPDVVWLLDILRKAGADEQAAALASRTAAHAPLDNPGRVARLLDGLRAAGADEQAAALASRAAAHAPLDNPHDAAFLLNILRKAGADEQVAALLARDPAAHAPLDDPGGVAWLLGSLLEAGADEQAAALLARDPAVHAPLDEPGGVARLLDGLRAAGADEQAAALASRAAAHAPLDNPDGVALLLDILRKAGADEQAAALLARDPAAHAPLDDPVAVTWLLRRLRKAGAHEQAAALASRAAAHAPLDNPYAVAWLLRRLRKAGAHQQAAALASRAAAHAPLDNPHDAALLLDILREAGADEQAAALLARAAAHAPLDDPNRMAWLLRGLQKAGADEQAAALLARDPAAHAALDNPYAVAWLLRRLQKAGAHQQAAALASRAAAHAALDNPGRVARLLRRLQKAGAHQQAAALASRAAAHAPLDNPDAVAWLLRRLQKAGAHQQVAALLQRDPAAHVSLDNPGGVARLLDNLRAAGAHQQITALAERAAAHVSLDNPGGVARLLDSLRKAGADEQITLLVDRLPGEGLFDLFRAQGSHRALYRFGRNPGGSPAEPWGWEDLD